MTQSDVWQARLGADSARFDDARAILGFTRSEAIRHALVHLEHDARQKQLADDYDLFYASASPPVENSIIAK
ncbi:MAG: hypothetical protein WC054_04865 [Candidatus Nanopelagicales bacterium]